MKVVVTSDKTLWLVKRADWCLPVYVSECRTEDGAVYWLVVPSLMPDLAQHTELHRVFGRYSVSVLSDRWIVPPNVVPLLCQQAPGITPEYHLVWPERPAVRQEPPIEVPLKEEDEMASRATDAFLKYIHQAQPEMNHDQLRAAWNMLTIYGADWIYKEGKTLDLGFALIDAVPYRANWKQIFLARFPNVARWFRMARDRRNAQMELNPDIASFIRGSWMVEMDPKHWFIQWSVEVRHTDAWRQYIAENERERYKHYSKYGYSAWWRAKINKLEKRIYDILCDFILGSAAPCAGIGPRDNHGRRFLVPHVPKGRIRPTRGRNIETPVVACDTTRDLASLGELGEIAFPDEVVSELPIVRPASLDVRNHR